MPFGNPRAFKVQVICPVFGFELAPHRRPVKVKIGDEHLFVC